MALTMRRFLAGLLLASPLALMAPAQAYPWMIQTYSYGSRTGGFSSGYVQGPGGYRGTYSGGRIGNYSYGTYRSPYGTTRIRSHRIGNFMLTNWD